jgi:hypothetical protein
LSKGGTELVDKLNPTSQFHPYQSPPETSKQAKAGGLSDILGKMGIDPSKLPERMRNADLKGGLNKARDYARGNPSMVLGGLAALVIGAGLMRKRSKPM